MSLNELEAKVTKLREWEELEAEARAEAESLRDEIKAEMQARETEELTAGKYIIRWTSIASARLDNAAFRKALPELYNSFLKQVSSRRFTVSV